MLEILYRIVQEVNAARDLDQALNIIVERVATATVSDVCSVYLAAEDLATLILMATRGLNPGVAGQVRLRLHEGLVGLVAEREEPINLGDAELHPRFRYIPETGEERFHAFLGVPIIHYRQLLGVLVVQRQERRRFDDDEVAFMVTMAAQLAGVIAYAQAVGSIDAPHSGRRAGPIRPLTGVAGAAGVAIGIGRVIYAPMDFTVALDRAPESVELEEETFLSAVCSVRKEFSELGEWLAGSVPDNEQMLFEVYLHILDGNTLVEEVRRRIRAGQSAVNAVRDAIAEQVRLFDEMEDPYLRERASDIRDIGRRLLIQLSAVDKDTRSIPERTILVGHEINATQLAEIPRDKLAGVVAATGSVNSHVAILARALGIPAVMGVVDLKAAQLEGRELIVDGYTGRIYAQPSRAVRREYRRLMREDAQISERLKELQSLPAMTLDGVNIGLYVNTGLVADVNSSLEIGCDGVGLHRTELPFMIRDRFPGEEEQVRLYRELLQAYAPRVVTLRTLDIGGDKMLSYFPIADEYPLLGWRGIRVMLDHPEIFMTQLRAMLRADLGLGNLQIMFPMISRLEEAEEAVQLVQRARKQLREDGMTVNNPKLGAMIEVPAAVYQAESLANRLDFLSIGSNDLAQYLLAVDRNNPRVAALYDELHPAVLRAVNSVAEVGCQANVPVCVCGEMAANPGIAPLLLAMRVNALSMSRASLLRVKWVIRSFSFSEAKELLGQALSMEYPEEVRALVRNALEGKGLGGLMRAGK
ncbi:phosphoenolpyruvate--protein phosphotransferase [Nitrococcus mobilis]|uniref:phosphoenolpyruvate--protein phosphotransferase n=1 Tax=Nitrococcus mobilis Nb-231 TaxID=314278 RepID=A4BSH3_9GAMM|nr:phosphoenolpyruvate--protein phosphotransferase [Nitrococcus mobilis]EAR21433.1 phosphoenolpyruvate-protein phosphotransferase [Nitrococcus mobilis Nb-231]